MKQVKTVQEYIADLIIDQCNFLKIDILDNFELMYGSLLSDAEVFCSSGLISSECNRTDIKQIKVGEYFKFMETKTGEWIPINKFHK